MVTDTKYQSGQYRLSPGRKGTGEFFNTIKYKTEAVYVTEDVKDPHISAALGKQALELVSEMHNSKSLVRLGLIRDLTFIGAVVILAILFAGTPDLMDAIVASITN